MKRTDTGWAEQINNEPVPLPFNKIVKAEFPVMRLDEAPQEVLPRRWQDEVGKRIVVPFDVLDFFDIKLDWAKKDI